jgi:ATP-dependent Clp protease ATP-binding subunit ClpX
VILEDMMLDIMYQLPSLSDVEECVITREVVENKINPISLLQKAV